MAAATRMRPNPRPSTWARVWVIVIMFPSCSYSMFPTYLPSSMARKIRSAALCSMFTITYFCINVYLHELHDPHGQYVLIYYKRSPKQLNARAPSISDILQMQRMCLFSCSRGATDVQSLQCATFHSHAMQQAPSPGLHDSRAWNWRQ